MKNTEGPGLNTDARQTGLLEADTEKQEAVLEQTEPMLTLTEGGSSDELIKTAEENIASAIAADLHKFEIDEAPEEIKAELEKAGTEFQTGALDAAQVLKQGVDEINKRTIPEEAREGFLRAQGMLHEAEALEKDGKPDPIVMEKVRQLEDESERVSMEAHQIEKVAREGKNKKKEAIKNAGPENIVGASSSAAENRPIDPATGNYQEVASPSKEPEILPRQDVSAENLQLEIENRRPATDEDIAAALNPAATVQSNPERTDFTISPLEEAKIVADVKRRGQAFEAATRPVSAQEIPTDTAEAVQTSETPKTSKSPENPESAESKNVTAQNAEQPAGPMQSGYDTLRDGLPRGFLHRMIDSFEAKDTSRRAGNLSIALAKAEGKFNNLESHMQPQAERFESITLKMQALENDGTISSDQKEIFKKKLEGERQSVQANIDAITKKQTALEDRRGWLRGEMEHYEKRCEQAVSRLSAKIDGKLAPNVEKAEILKGKESDLVGEIQKHESLISDYRQQVRSFEGKPHTKRALRALTKLIDQNEKALEKRQKSLDKIRGKLIPIQGKISSLEMKKGGYKDLVQDRGDTHPDSELEKKDEEPKEDRNSERKDQPDADSESGPIPLAPEITPEVTPEIISGQDAEENEVAEKLTLPLKTFIEDWNSYVSKLNNRDLPKVEFDPSTERDQHETIMRNLKKREGYQVPVDEQNFSSELYQGYVREYLNAKNIKLDTPEKVNRLKAGLAEFTRRIIADHAKK